MVSAGRVLALVLASTFPVAARATCDDLMPTRGPVAGQRSITAEDLIRLRDVGHPDANIDDASPFAVSPDGASVAFVVTRADIDRNTYCRGLVVVPLASGNAPRIIDRGGELPIVSGEFRGMLVPTGYPEIVTPGWSPDGQWIAYLKRERGITRLWRVKADGSQRAAVTTSSTDIENWAWATDGRDIVISRRPARIVEDAKLDEEGRSGFLYDDRITPDVSWRPQLRIGSIPLETSVIDLDTGTVRAATAIEAGLLPQPPAVGTQDHPDAISPDGRGAWTEKVGSAPFSASRIWTTDRRGSRVPCKHAACSGRISRLWWNTGGTSLLFLRREGWNFEDTALYQWRPRRGSVSLVLRTRDALSGCRQLPDGLICGRENATTPRRIVRIATTTGRSETILDLNPEIASVSLGKVERLRFTSARGLPAWGDLVLPPGYDGATRLPLIVVQYFSRGFLRGGIGDDYPIYLLAAHGFAVLSFEKPPHVAFGMSGLKTYDDVNAAGRRDWGERRSILSALERGIDQTIARGLVDPARIGITGLSDGVSTVEFALINSSRFKAAAISTCCTEPNTVMTYGGTAWADWNRQVMEYPAASRPDRSFWLPQSLSLNAERIDTPVLMQLADSEALLGLETFTALREQRKPVELHVFPGELHNKWQPAHRAAVYDRDIDWFAFWLRGQEDPAPAKRQQYERWSKLRDQRVGGSGSAHRR